MSYSIYCDWSEERENYNNIGKDALINFCTHTSQDKSEKKENRTFNTSYSGYCDECGINESVAEPMMNYIYPLECSNFTDEQILKVVKETNCTIMEKDDKYFLTLCGGGMDLSQDIAYAYFILENWCPADLLGEVCKQPLLSLGSKNYKFLAKNMIRQFKQEIDNNKRRMKEWKDSLKELQLKERAKKQEVKTAI